jgi:UDP-N-acetylglucosamine 1-carboxyvinyltransferase
MGSFKIEGGRRLKGELTPQGAKNEALQILCAVLLTSEPVTIHNVPDIVDVNKLIDLLRQMGVKPWRSSDDGSYRFTAKDVDIEFFLRSRVHKDGWRPARKCDGRAVRRWRASVAATSPPPVATRSAGADWTPTSSVSKSWGPRFKYDRRKGSTAPKRNKLKGAYMLLDEASVTGTANIVMAAVLAEGRTTIFNAACEPYLQQLCNMLVRMGAKITGIGSNLLHIDGVKELGGTEHRMLPDMIEIGSASSAWPP